MLYDLIIVGAGPAGLTAVIYAKRAFLKTLIFEKSVRGGKLNKTAEIQNYPAFSSIQGPELAQKMTKHALDYGVEWSDQEVLKIEKKGFQFIIHTNQKTFSSKTVIVASGAIENKLGIKGEKEFTNLGVSYCAICDGYLFRGQVVVVGGGYSALETALYMSNIASKVYLVHRRESFRADPEIVAEVQTKPKIIFFLNSVVSEIKGTTTVEKVIIQKTDGLFLPRELLVQAVFPCVGLTPFSHFIHSLGICDSQDYIRINPDCSTAIPGFFAAGDVARNTEKKIRQIVTAISEGAIAAQSVIEYLKK
jgi:thioredoxin reductase (NADPH)